MPERIQLRRTKGWKMPSNAVRVDRATKWGNPFVVGKHGTRDECVRLYRLLMAGNICLTTGDPKEQMAAYKHVREYVARLRGKDLACWCTPGKPCHADVLLEIANREDNAQ